MRPPPPPPPEPEPAPEPEPVYATYYVVFFEFDSSELSNSAMQTLDEASRNGPGDEALQDHHSGPHRPRGSG